jgi:hypothetical protein
MWRVAQGDEVRERRGRKRERPGLRSLVGTNLLVGLITVVFLGGLSTNFFRGRDIAAAAFLTVARFVLSYFFDEKGDEPDRPPTGLELISRSAVPIAILAAGSPLANKLGLEPNTTERGIFLLGLGAAAFGLVILWDRRAYHEKRGAEAQGADGDGSDLTSSS